MSMVLLGGLGSLVGFCAGLLGLTFLGCWVIEKLCRRLKVAEHMVSYFLYRAVHGRWAGKDIDRLDDLEDKNRALSEQVNDIQRGILEALSLLSEFGVQWKTKQTHVREKLEELVP